MRTLGMAAAICGGVLDGPPDATFHGIGIDSRTLAPGALFFALAGRRDGHDFVDDAKGRGAAAAVVSRRLPVGIPQILVADVLLALQSFAAAWRRRHAPVLIAVTGSNGKTTVKQMIGAIAAQTGQALVTRGNLNNHIGVPLTLAELDHDHDYAVIEMGANHPGEIRLLASLAAPQVGLVTNAGDAHLEGFGSRPGVARAKGELFEQLGPEATAVINADDPYAPLWEQLAAPARVLRFGRSADAQLRLLDARPEGTGQRIVLSGDGHEHALLLPLAGEHNALNATAAAAAARAAGIGWSQVLAGLASCQAAPGRGAVRPLPGGALLIDDSYNANPDSVRAAIARLAAASGERWLVLGDMAELGAQAAALHAAVGKAARQAGIEHLIGCGALVRHAVEAFGDGGIACDDPRQAAALLAERLKPGDTVLVKGSRSARMERVIEALIPASERGGRCSTN